jgi:hypothetical protein
MIEPTPPPAGETPPAENTPPAETPPAVTAEDVARLQDALKKERDLRKAAEGQIKSTVTDTERAVAEAEERGRAAIRAEYGQQLAQTRFEAEAARRNPGYDVAKALKYVNLAGFLGEDGAPDAKAIAAAVADLVPEAATGPTPPPSFDGGTRQAAPASASMTQLIRQAAGRA